MNLKEINSKFKSRKKELKNAHKTVVDESRDKYKSALSHERDIYDVEVDEYYRVTGKKPPKPMPRRSLMEEIGNSVTHGLGSVFSIVALVLMLVFSSSPSESVAASLYFVGMFLAFTVSCLYHSFRGGSNVKRLFRRFDYSSIYLLIGATFAPILLAYMGDAFGIIFFIIQWCVIAVGITLVGVFGPSRLRFIHIPLYVILGWSALMLLPTLIAGSFPLAMFILAGGIVYSVGIIPFAIKVKVSHFIWHIFVLAGAVVQWIGIFTYVYVL